MRIWEVVLTGIVRDHDRIWALEIVAFFLSLFPFFLNIFLLFFWIFDFGQISCSEREKVSCACVCVVALCSLFFGKISVPWRQALKRITKKPKLDWQKKRRCRKIHNLIQNQDNPRCLSLTSSLTGELFCQNEIHLQEPFFLSVNSKLDI